ncbi:MAG: sugar phosphate isomerase/epimerase [Candidatus Hydrogenedentes bacterium]|nr:sugar phosphate isomerase/epimerase [Candidatus Hydrogenedentota bacterium]
MNRRKFIRNSLVGLGLVTAVTDSRSEHKSLENRSRYQNGVSPWPLVLNTSTIRPASLEDKVKITAGAGWDGIEPWISELEEYEKKGGNLKDLGKQIKDLGLMVPNVIGLWDSMPEGEEAFRESLKVTRNRMRMASDIGSKFVAAIPGPDRENFDVKWGARCYKELLKIGEEEYNIRPAVEFVGFFKGVYRFGQACAIAIDADDPRACIIADTFHLFRGGSGFSGLNLVQGDLIAHFHWNDVPGDVPREEQGDSHRVLPGDGVLPLKEVLITLKKIGYKGCLSLEIFKRDLWESDLRKVAELGLQKMIECVRGAGV